MKSEMHTYLEFTQDPVKYWFWNGKYINEKIEMPLTYKIIEIKNSFIVTHNDKLLSYAFTLEKAKKIADDHFNNYYINGGIRNEN